MLKNLVRLEFIVAEKAYHFICEPDSPIEHIKEALFQCQKYVGQIEDNIRQQMAEKAQQEAPKEDEVKEESKPAE